jgi:hypothetical protein
MTYKGNVALWNGRAARQKAQAAAQEAEQAAGEAAIAEYERLTREASPIVQPPVRRHKPAQPEPIEAPAEPVTEQE